MVFEKEERTFLEIETNDDSDFHYDLMGSGLLLKLKSGAYTFFGGGKDFLKREKGEKDFFSVFKTGSSYFCY